MCEHVLVTQPHLSLSQLPLFLCDVILRKQICTFLPLVRRVVFVPQDHCVSAQEVGTAWTHIHTVREQCTDRFRKLFIMISRTLTLHYLSKNCQRSNMCIWNRFCASNCILMDCQWFCDGFLAMYLTCWGSLGRFSVQESLLYGSSLSPAFQSNVADSEPHLHQIYLRSGRR